MEGLLRIGGDVLDLSMLMGIADVQLVHPGSAVASTGMSWCAMACSMEPS